MCGGEGGEDVTCKSEKQGMSAGGATIYIAMGRKAVGRVEVEVKVKSVL